MLAVNSKWFPGYMGPFVTSGPSVANEETEGEEGKGRRRPGVRGSAAAPPCPPCPPALARHSGVDGTASNYARRLDSSCKHDIIPKESRRAGGGGGDCPGGRGRVAPKLAPQRQEQGALQVTRALGQHKPTHQYSTEAAAWGRDAVAHGGVKASAEGKTRRDLCSRWQLPNSAASGQPRPGRRTPAKNQGTIRSC